MNRKALHLLSALGAAFALSAVTSAASAAIIQIDFTSPTSGSPNPAMGSVVLEFDPDSDVALTSDGVLFSDLNFDLDGDVGFQYYSYGQLVIGDNLDSGASYDENDFLLSIVGLNTATPSVSQFALAQTVQGFIAFDASAVAFSITELDSFPTSEVPIPGALALMLSGLAGLGYAGRRKSAPVF